MILSNPAAVPSDADICVVGAGPVGLAVAIRCARQGLTVTVIEAGSAEPESGPEEGGPQPVPSQHALLSQATGSGIGGTSRLWGGRCVAFDDIDFEPRPFVAHSGWPIPHSSCATYYADALQFLGCDPAEPPPLRLPGTAVAADAIERWCREPNIAVLHEKTLRRSARIRIFTGCRVTDLELTPDGRSVSGIVAMHAGRRLKLSAHRFVLAAGGLGNARVLLAAQRRWPAKFGGEEGALGRFYMGHLTGYLATIRFHDRRMAEQFWYRRGRRGTSTRRRLLIAPPLQRSASLLNTSFWLDNISVADPTHGSGALSALYGGLRTFGLHRRLATGLAPSLPARAAAQSAGHRRNIAQSKSVGRDLLRMAGHFCRHGLGSRVYGLTNPQGRYLLRYHAEQAPSSRNRVRLAGEAADAPFPRLEVDFGFQRQDVESALRAHAVLDEWLRDHQLGALEFFAPEPARNEQVLAQALDGFHQIGLTRMSADPRDGVVDPHCRVHDTDNLYVAGSSVFPTAGQANPTLLAVALALRLADHLAASS